MKTLQELICETLLQEKHIFKYEDYVSFVDRDKADRQIKCIIDDKKFETALNQQLSRVYITDNKGKTVVDLKGVKKLFTDLKNQQNIELDGKFLEFSQFINNSNKFKDNEGNDISIKVTIDNDAEKFEIVKKSKSEVKLKITGDHGVSITFNKNQQTKYLHISKEITVVIQLNDIKNQQLKDFLQK